MPTVKVWKQMYDQGSMPTGVREKIVAQLAQSGQPITEQWILHAWRKSLGVPDYQNPIPMF